jgi:hypothetical protein
VLVDDPAPPVAAHEPVEDQSLERLADRRPAHPEPVGQLDLDEALVGPQLSVDDVGAHAVVDLVGAERGDGEHRGRRAVADHRDHLAGA